MLILTASISLLQGDAPAPTVEELVKNLGSDEFKVRDEAQKKLESMGPDILPKLKEALESTEDMETKTRLTDIIAKFEKPSPPPAPDKAKQAQEQLKKAKEILAQITKLLENKDKSDEEKLKELAALARSLDQTLRRRWVDRVRPGIKIIEDPQGGFRIEREPPGEEPKPPEKKLPEKE